MSGLHAKHQPDIEQIYGDHRRALLRLAFLLTGSHDLAEDIVQTAFATAHPRWASLEEPVPYLRRVIVNQANDTHRRRYRRGPPDSAERVTHIPDIDETWAELLRLSPRQRAVIVLRFYEDLPLNEIAQILGRPDGTVRSDLHRALEHLRRVLS